MSDSSSPDLWTLTPDMQAVALVAETLYRFSRRRWWRRKPSPMDFVPAARQIVAALKAAGYV